MAEAPAISRRRRAVARGTLVAVALLCACAIIPRMFLEDMMLFPRQYAPQAPPRPPYPGAVLLTRDIGGGERVEAIFIPVRPRGADGSALAPSAAAGGPAPLVVYFHGNAEIQDQQEHIVEGYGRLGFNVLLPEYRGYGRSGGAPSQEAIRDDAAHFVDEAHRRPGVDPARLVVHGRSLGGGAAADLARVRRPVAMVLESTFLSVPAMAWGMGVPGFLAKNKFQTDEVVKAADFPMLIFHGDVDDVVPVRHGRALRDLNPRVAYVEYRCAHNDFPGGSDDDYWKRIGAFLAGL